MCLAQKHLATGSLLQPKNPLTFFGTNNSDVDFRRFCKPTYTPHRYTPTSFVALFLFLQAIEELNSKKKTKQFMKQSEYKMLCIKIC